MESALQQKIIEYKKAHISSPQYVLEVGSLDLTGGNRHLFPEVDNFCGLDDKRGPGVDMCFNLEEVDRLFDFNPDVIICLDIFKTKSSIKKIIKSIRNTLMPGGYIMIFLPKEGEGSYADAFFNGYEVYDLSLVNSTICGLARKPLK